MVVVVELVMFVRIGDGDGVDDDDCLVMLVN